MKILPVCTVLLSSLIAGVYLASGAYFDEACNCDHCFKTNTDKKDVISPPVPPLYKEDTDGDGLTEICARARDYPDRQFQTVCHMLCHNRCTRFNVTEIVEGQYKRYITTAYRTNYYKLRDGPCDKTHM